MDHHPTATEQGILDAARANRGRCLCGEVHGDDGITPDVIARMLGYLAENPGHQFAVDEEAGIVAVIASRDPSDADDPGAPEIIARSEDLVELLDLVNAPPAESLSLCRPAISCHLWHFAG